MNVLASQDPRSFRAAQPLLLCVWAIAVGAGFGILWRFQSKPGQAALTVPEYPLAEVLPQIPGRHTLVMLLHPDCPCSRASIDELEIVLADAPRPPTVGILFVRENAADRTETSALRIAASRIAGVKLIDDREGALAARMRCETSGQVFLYDPAGSLCFSGGITVFRGHAGDNEGRRAVQSILKAVRPALTTTPVFGCALW